MIETEADLYEEMAAYIEKHGWVQGRFRGDDEEVCLMRAYGPFGALRTGVPHTLFHAVLTLRRWCHEMERRARPYQAGSARQAT